MPRKTWLPRITLCDDLTALIDGGRRRNLTDYHLKRVLGMKPTSKWPDAGMPTRKLGNVLITIKPFVKNTQAHVHRGTRHSWRTRAVVQCPACDCRMNVGRLHQHMKVHPGRNNVGVWGSLAEGAIADLSFPIDVISEGRYIGLDNPA